MWDTPSDRHPGRRGADSLLTGRGEGSGHSLFSTFIRFDSMKATFSLCSVYSCRRSSLAASIRSGFLEDWTRRLGLTARLCSATEEVSLKSEGEAFSERHPHPAPLGLPSVPTPHATLSPGFARIPHHVAKPTRR